MCFFFASCYFCSLCMHFMYTTFCVYKTEPSILYMVKCSTNTLPASRVVRKFYILHPYMYVLLELKTAFRMGFIAFIFSPLSLSLHLFFDCKVCLQILCLLLSSSLPISLINTMYDYTHIYMYLWKNSLGPFKLRCCNSKYTYTHTHTYNSSSDMHWFGLIFLVCSILHVMYTAHCI